MYLNLSDLQRKDIVSIEDGRRLGRIIDAQISSNGIIEHFIVLDYKFWRFWKGNNEFTVLFSQIKKIGTDVILIEL